MWNLFAALWAWLNGLPPAPKPEPQPAPAPPPTADLAKPLDYLIGSDMRHEGSESRITEVAYNAPPARRGISIGYCNLFDETNSGRFGPYLTGQSDTAEEYGEGHIDPKGPGWGKNLHEQYVLRAKQGFRYIELDNPDAYSVEDVVSAVDMARAYGLRVIAKNPLLMEGDPAPYVDLCLGVIVERGAGNPKDMDALRRRVGKPDLPVWFVAFRKGGSDGRAWIGNTAAQARAFRNMFCSYSRDGEYTSSEDIRV